MNISQFHIDGASNTLTKALDDFLRDKKLQLTTQQYERLKKLLMIRQLDEEMSYSSAYNHLSELIEYRKDYEIDANAPDEAEEEMIRIIGAADTKEVEVIVEKTEFKKRFLIAASILAFIFTGFIGKKYFQHVEEKTTKMASVISTDDEKNLKNLVQKIVDAETTAENTITVNAVYNDIKKLEAVQNAGDATSYKKFNYGQYQVAIEYLNNRLASTQPAAGD